ncbi:MAG: galactokinase [Candidatus Methylacidiphilales bacterium]|nr:galactokinase [Candidatus Methylacidiphilales bacterium]
MSSDSSTTSAAAIAESRTQKPALRVYAPGRAELLGNHTDYNAGLVMAIAVNRGITLTARPLHDGLIHLRALDIHREYHGRVDQLHPSTTEAWANYVLGVAFQFVATGRTLGGFEISITSDLPMGAGLSSSAALEISTALALADLFGHEIEPLELTRIAQKAEHEFAGVKCGLLDQIASLMSAKGAITSIDCRTTTVTPVDMPAGGVFVIADPHAKHQLVSGEYNERRASCESAAAKLGVPFLRDITTESLKASRHLLTDREYHRALHVVGETERVALGAEALATGDLAAFGALMFESHESSIHNFENSCHELDTLVKAARGFKGCLGARLSGGGFGGATINLVRAGEENAFIQALKQAWPKVDCLVTPACAGAGVQS